MYADIYWSRQLFPPPGDLPDPQIEPTSPVSPALQADSFPSEPPAEAFLLSHHYVTNIQVLWTHINGVGRSGKLALALNTF